MAIKQDLNPVHDYQSLQIELDSVVTKLQEGSVDIDDAFILYTRGNEIVKILQDRLNITNNKVVKLQKNRKL